MNLMQRVLAGLLAFILTCGAVHGQPITETFTYQGVLNDGGVAANGMYDIKVQFFLQDGTPFLTTLTFLDYEVVDGLMTLPIDLTNVFVFGERRFLQISVRPSGTTTFTALSPRTEVTTTPYSVYAIKAGEADTADVADSALVATTSLDNEWSRLGTIVSAGSGVDRVMLNPSLTGGTILNSSTDLQLNFDDSGFGGMYINSQTSGGAPFYGFAHDNSAVAYIEYRESADLIRFFNVGGFGPTLSLGNTTATVPILSAETEIVKDYGSSQYHRNGPIAYGVFDFDGSRISGTPNINAVWDNVLDRYIVSVSGEIINFQFYTAVVTPINSNPRVASTDSVNGDLIVYIHNLGSVRVQNRYSLAIYENAAVAAD